MKQYKLKSVFIIDMVLTHELVQIYCEHSPNLQWKALTAKKSIGGKYNFRHTISCRKKLITKKILSYSSNVLICFFLNPNLINKGIDCIIIQDICNN